MAVTYWRENYASDPRGEPWALWRIDEDDPSRGYERWDRPTGLWIRDPEGVFLTGIGGWSDTAVISKATAERWIRKWERQRARTS